LSAPLAFTTAAHYNQYLPVEGGVLDVILTIVAVGTGPAAPRTAGAPGLAEVILLDCSGSMGAPQAKIHAARQAAGAAIDTLREGVAFAVVEGFERARMVYPEDRQLAIANERTRAAARTAVRRLNAHGGTAIGRWLRLADELLSGRPGAIGHAIMLTDGRNESESAADLNAALAACSGRFTVDCRAIGSATGIHDWDGPELLRIAEALGANPVVPVEDLSVLPGDFAAMMDRAMSRIAGDVRLRIRTPGLARVQFVKQVYPLIADLTDRGEPVGDRSADYPTGAWGPDDRRDYHIRLEIDGGKPGTPGRAAWFGLRPGAQPDEPEPEEAAVLVEWSHDAAQYTDYPPPVIYYTSQQDHASAIQRGWEAFQAGRLDAAEQQLGRAVALAHRAGDEDKLRVLARLVDIQDPAAGRVRLRPDIDSRHWPPVTARGSQTSQWHGNSQPPLPPPDDEPVASGPCPRCAATLTGRFCGECGWPGPGST
jgi:hypothetical protein